MFLGVSYVSDIELLNKQCKEDDYLLYPCIFIILPSVFIILPFICSYCLR